MGPPRFNIRSSPAEKYKVPVLDRAWTSRITWGSGIAKNAKATACRTFPEVETRGLAYAGSILFAKWDVELPGCSKLLRHFFRFISPPSDSSFDFPSFLALIPSILRVKELILRRIAYTSTQVRYTNYYITFRSVIIPVWDGVSTGVQECPVLQARRTVVDSRHHRGLHIALQTTDPSRS